MNSKINLIFDLKGSERKLSINKYFNKKIQNWMDLNFFPNGIIREYIKQFDNFEKMTKKIMRFYIYFI